MSVNRAEKEASVYGHEGGGLVECTLMSLALPIILKVTQSPISFHQELIYIGIPFILSLTVAGDELPFGAFTLPLICLVLWIRNGRHDVDSDAGSRESVTGREVRDILTILRASVSLTTCVAILAVDFPNIFPRRFVKTEWFGTSVMDGGSGAYVFTGAIVRGNKNCSFSQTLKNSIPLIILGVSRYLSTMFVGYQEHVGEYGVQWNFFTTLACVRLGSDLCFAIARTPVLRMSIGIALVSLHQYLLSTTLVGDWVMKDESTESRINQGNFLWQNKEGLISLIGYLSLDLCTRASANWLLSQTVEKQLVVDLILWTFLNFCNERISPISRRSANLGYVVWMVASGLLIIVCSRFLLLHRKHPFSLVELASRQQLVLFLVANVMTGVVNLTIDTLHTPKPLALGILLLYFIGACSLTRLRETRAS